MEQACHFANSKEGIKGRAKLIYLADETEAVGLPAKITCVILVYRKICEGE